VLPALENPADWKAWRDYLQQLLASPPLSYLLYPFRLVLGPYLASSTLEFAKAFLFAVGIILLHYAWVVRSNVAFEEASVAFSQKYAEKIAAARAGRALDVPPKKPVRAPFRLAPTGFAPVALFWKNLISVQTWFRGRTLAMVVLPLFVFGIFMSLNAEHTSGVLTLSVLMLAGMCFIWSLLLGAQLVRCDFRRDLPALDVLKVLPLRGWQIVVGEVLAPAVILTAVQWLILLLLGVLLHFAGPGAKLPPIPVPWFFAAAFISPFWNGLALLIPNAAVLWFPGWFQSRPDAPHGIEVTGQRLLLVLGQFFVIGVTIVPAVLAFAAGFVPLQFAGAEAIAPLVGALGAAVVLSAEIALGVWLVGKLFDRFDLAAEEGG